MRWFDWMLRRVAEETPRMTYCPHGQNPQACLSCWRARPSVLVVEEAKPPPEPDATRVVHMACGCRLSVRGGEAWNLQQCAQHGRSKLDAAWFWHEHKARIAHWEHTVDERGGCEDSRCERASTRKSNRRAKRREDAA